MKFKILFEQGSRHDATIYYVDSLKEALEKISDFPVEIIESVHQIDNSNDIVVVVNVKSHLRVLLKNRKQRVMCWYQGIMPEEIKVNYKKWDKYLKIVLWTFFEYISLKNVKFSFFVSEKMKQHYEQKYRASFNDKFYIMPCINQELLEDAFNTVNKYSKPTFVYAGTMSEWQCINEILSIYEYYETHANNKSSLTIYTPEQKEAKVLLKNYKIKNVNVDYLPFTELSEQIKKYKYGFIIRKDIIMNNVSTPTKMNSYLANGIIPIYSDAINAFKENLSDMTFKIDVKSEDRIELIYKKIQQFENVEIMSADVLKDFKSNAFETFYNKDYHVKEIAKKLRSKL